MKKGKCIDFNLRVEGEMEGLRITEHMHKYQIDDITEKWQNTTENCMKEAIPMKTTQTIKKKTISRPFLNYIQHC